ncbi:MAG: IclR family transcriptional regulator [Deltaproteobacteria bacterium]|nr:IclR family transcriptional regulator [Deltaproteobacteria bacterium]
MPKSSSKPKSDYAIQTVTNALRMLEVFHTETEMGVSDLARRLGLHKNNAFRLLATLELSGYIQQTPQTDLYHLGPRCLELAHAFARSHTLLNQARPILEELASEFGETAHLGVLSEADRGHEVVHLEGVLPDQLVLTGSRVGERLPAHCTALGKVLLAGELSNRSVPMLASDGRADPVAGGSAAAAGAQASLLVGESRDQDLQRYTDATVSDPVKLADELRGIQLRGYSVDLEEYSPGLRCVAAPVRDAHTRVIAALSLSGPSLRLTEEALHGAAARAIAEAATRLSRELGSPV